jgi:hypothetical protein
MSLAHDDVEYVQQVTYEQVQGIVNNEDLLWLASLQPRDDEHGNPRPPWFAASMAGRSKTCDPPYSLKISSRPSILRGFDMLPVEIAHQILVQLDFVSLKCFSETCSKARRIVRSLPEFRALTYHIPEFLKLLNSSGMIKWHSARDLYAAFRTALCSTCGNHDSDLYLPTCQRFCRQCWIKDPFWFFVLHKSMLGWFPDIAHLVEETSLHRPRLLPSAGFLPAAEHRRNFVCFTWTLFDPILDMLHESGQLWFQLMSAYRHLQRRQPHLFSRDHGGLKHEELEDPWDSWSMSKALQRVAATWQTVDLPKKVTFKFLLDLEPESRELLFARLPFLGDTGEIERGIYCRVCAQASVENRLSSQPKFVSLRMQGDSSHTRMSVHQASGLRWTRAGFFEHIRECPCIKIMMDR